MKFKRLMAAAMAGVIAVSSAVVWQITASAAEKTLYEFEAGVISSWAFTEEAISAVQGATSKFSVTIDAVGDGYFYLQATPSWSSTLGGNPTVEVDTSNDKWSSFTTATGINVIISGYTKVNTITVSVDGGTAIKIFDVNTAPAGMVFASSGTNYVISADKLADAGVTSDNIADAKLIATIVSAGASKEIAILASDGNAWKNQFYWSNSMEAGTVEFPLTGTSGSTELNDTPLTTGVCFHGKDMVISKFVITVPDETTEEPSEEASTEESSEEASTEESSTEESGTEEADSTSDYALLYDKKVEITTKYESAQIPVKAVAGDEITVTYKLNDAGEYHQLSFKHAGEGWPALTSPKYTNEWNCVDVNADGTFTFTLNAEDAANITANNLVVSGYSVTYTKVELNADKKPAEEPSSSYDTLTEKKVDDFKTDGTSELHVMSITPEDAAQYSAYEIKVTLSNGKVAKKTTSKCYDSFKYTNTSDTVSTESSEENYFIVVKIINIPADVTVSSVEITPVD